MFGFELSTVILALSVWLVLFIGFSGFVRHPQREVEYVRTDSDDRLPPGHR